MSKLSLSANEKIITRYPWYNLGYLDIYEYICNQDRESSNIYLHKAALRVHSRERLYEIYKSVLEKELLELSQEAVENITPDSVSESTTEPVLESTTKPVPEPTPGSVSQSTTKPVPEPTPDSVLESKPAAKTFPEDNLGSVSEEEIILNQITDFVPDNMPRFVLAGGDYFTRKDFEQVELDRSQPLDNFIAEKPTLLRSLVKGKKSEPLRVNEIDTSELFDDASFYTETLAAIYKEQGFYKRAIDVYAKLILLYPEKSSYFATLVKELKRKHKI